LEQNNLKAKYANTILTTYAHRNKVEIFTKIGSVKNA